MRIAVISDIHGNRLALEAVLNDIRRRGTDSILNLGDCLYGPLDPSGTADILMEGTILNISGNEDRILLQDDNRNASARSLACTRAQLNSSHREWLSSLPATAIYQDHVYLCHGTPADDCRYLLERVTDRGVSLKSHRDIAKQLESVEQKIILCGHSHQPRSVELSDGRLIINPGSVGLPAYADDQPYPHVMETGTPHAHYCLLTHSARRWDPEHIPVAYAHNDAADMALHNGRSDWAAWLRTGQAAV